MPTPARGRERHTGDDLARERAPVLAQVLNFFGIGFGQLDLGVNDEILDQPVEAQRRDLNVVREVPDFARLEDNPFLHHDGREAEDAVERGEQFMRQRHADIAAQVLQFPFRPTLNRSLFFQSRFYGRHQL